jgi:hypothetical protein
MVANNNKNSTPVEKDTEPVFRMGNDTSPSRGLLSLVNKRRISGALLIIILVGGGWLIVTKVHFGSKVYAQVDGHKIYKKDIQVVKADNKSISDNAAATVLANKYLSQAMAREQNITIGTTDITAGNCPDQKKNPFGYQTCVNRLYFTKLGNENEGIYKGKAIVANFSRYIPFPSPLLEKQKALNPKIGDPAAIAADKAYAKSFITNLYDQIKAGKISFDQAIQMEHADPIVGEQAYPSQPHSGPFDGKISQSNLISADSIRQKIANMKPGEITKPFAPSGPPSLAPDHTRETYFLVVDMEQITGGHGKVSFDQEIQQAKKKLGYKINV